MKPLDELIMHQKRQLQTEMDRVYHRHNYEYRVFKQPKARMAARKIFDIMNWLENLLLRQIKAKVRKVFSFHLRSKLVRGFPDCFHSLHGLRVYQPYLGVTDICFRLNFN